MMGVKGGGGCQPSATTQVGGPSTADRTSTPDRTRALDNNRKGCQGRTRTCRLDIQTWVGPIRAMWNRQAVCEEGMSEERCTAANVQAQPCTPNGELLTSSPQMRVQDGGRVGQTRSFQQGCGGGQGPHTTAHIRWEKPQSQRSCRRLPQAVWTASCLSHQPPGSGCGCGSQ